MREILFKAKRIDNGEWVEGWLFKTQEHSYIAYDRQFDDDLFLSPKNIFIEVDTNTICQYTGLKDKNGNKIWENDVVKIAYWENYFENGVVRYYEQDVRYRFCAESGQFSFDNTDTIEVLGNIFDNPEFLEGGAE